MNTSVLERIILRNHKPEIHEIEFSALPKSGVYCLFNSDSGKIYIGSSRNCKSRIKSHIEKLVYRKHYLADLQSDYSKGPLSIIPFVIQHTESEMAARMLEAYWLIASKKERLYNVQSVWFSLPSEYIKPGNGSDETIKIARSIGLSNVPEILNERPVFFRMHFSLSKDNMVSTAESIFRNQQYFYGNDARHQ